MLIHQQSLCKNIKPILKKMRSIQLYTKWLCRNFPCGGGGKGVRHRQKKDTRKRKTIGYILIHIKILIDSGTNNV